MAESLEEGSHPEAGQADQIRQQLNRAVAEAGVLARGLHPIGLEADDLTDALSKLAHDTTELGHVSCRFTCHGPVLINHDDVARQMYRVAQESVNNAVKHAKSRHVEISLEQVDDRVVLRVADDGVGIPLKSPGSSGLGLDIIRYRAKMIGAHLQIKRGSKGGTEVICSVPLSADLGAGQ